MARITVEDCLEKVQNRFQLAIVAAKRTKQLLAGATSTLKNVENKSAVLALREIADGTVRLATEEELEEIAKLNEEQNSEKASIENKYSEIDKVFSGSSDSNGKDEDAKNNDVN